MIGQGPGARSVKLPMPAVHAHRRDDARGAADGAAARRASASSTGSTSTTRPISPRSSRDRRAFSAWRSTPEAAHEIARRSRGTPRIANRLLRRVRDFAQVRADGRVTERGLPRCARAARGGRARLRRSRPPAAPARSSTSSAGGPVGLNSLAAAIGEEKDAIEDIYEPYLIQIGFLDRTSRGRVATARAYEYFGLTAPGKERLW